MAAAKQYDRTARLNQVCQLLYLYPQGITADRLAELCEVSKRTIYRDLQAIQRDRGIPIWDQDGRYRLDERHFLPPLKLSLTELGVVIGHSFRNTVFAMGRWLMMPCASGKPLSVFPRTVAGVAPGWRLRSPQ